MGKIRMMRNHPGRIPNNAKRIAVIVVFVLCVSALLSGLLLQGVSEKRALTFQDMMKFKAIREQKISEKGDVIAYTAQPDRGNSEVMIYNVTDKKSYSIPRAKGPVISKDSHWVAAMVQPDALEMEKAEQKDKLKTALAILDTTSGKITNIENVKNFLFSDDSAWIAYAVFPEEKKDEKPGDDKAKKEEKGPEAKPEEKKSEEKKVEEKKPEEVKPVEKKAEEPKPEEKKAEEKKTEEVKPAEKKAEEKKPGEAKPEEKKPEGKDDKKKDEGEKVDTDTYMLRNLATGKEIKIEKVSNWAFDQSSKFVAYSIFDKDDAKQNRLCIRDLKTTGEVEKKLHSIEDARYSNLTWGKKKSRLAVIFYTPEKKEEVKSEKDTKEAKEVKDPKENKETKETTDAKPVEKPKPAMITKKYISELLVWDGLKDKLVIAVPNERQLKGWVLPSENNLMWTEDEARLGFGFKPEDEYLWTHPKKDKIEPEKIDIYSVEQILEKKGADVWHWNDPIINPAQKIRWEELKKQTYPAVYHFDENRFLPLTDKDMPEIQPTENPEYALGYSDRPYQVESTWTGGAQDFYLVNLKNGARQKILTRLQFDAQLSYNGRYVLYYKDKHWYLYTIRTGTTKNLTESIPTPFYTEDHDMPSATPPYFPVYWTENDMSVVIPDKYDLWEFPTAGGEPVCITNGEGRKNNITYRINWTDPDDKFIKKNKTLLLTGFSQEEKNTGFYSATIGKKGITKLIQEPGKTFRLRMKAKKADKYLFSRESYDEFPDLLVSNDMTFKSFEKVSNLGPQKDQFLWGKAELIEWKSLDGIRLQGAVFKPENYDKNKRYPVVVYFYEIMSTMACSWFDINVSHRPCFPFYNGNDYVVFLPDIKYEVGRPGLSSVKCLVPGVQKLIDLGIADPKRVGLQGHSWSGYQAAFIITQTDMFAAAVAGAAVTNMTSAYSGIRWESGIARQFQYEQSQSRIGPSLNSAPHLYFENSPVFYADRVNTPLLLEFGDKDGAVPWYQGIEMYLALRRLNKNCILLQYNDEPHWPMKYPNKVDYAQKMKEYFDHYLKGLPAPEWITKGVPYQQQTPSAPSGGPAGGMPPRRR